MAVDGFLRKFDGVPVEVAYGLALDFAAGRKYLVGDVPAAVAVGGDKPELLEDLKRAACLVLRNGRVQVRCDLGDVARVLGEPDERPQCRTAPAAEVGKFRLGEYARFHFAQFHEPVVKFRKGLLGLGLVETVERLEIFCPAVVELAEADEHGERILVQVSALLENADKPGRVHTCLLAQVAIASEGVVLFAFGKPILQKIAIFKILQYVYHTYNLPKTTKNGLLRAKTVVFPLHSAQQMAEKCRKSAENHAKNRPQNTVMEKSCMGKEICYK